jgi:endoglucanase
MTLAAPRRLVVAICLAVTLLAAGACSMPGARVTEAQSRAPYTLTTGPFAGRSLYVSPTTSAARAAARQTNPTVRALLTRLAGVPQAIWLTGGSPATTATSVATTVRAAATGGKVTQFVVYDIPQRDCHSSGARTAAAYRAYVAAIATALRGAHAIVVLEPDALSMLSCLSSAGQASRLQLLRSAVSTLSNVRNVAVYLDAGHAHWQSASRMAARLGQAGVARARGFSLDVSNFDPIGSELRYGASISALIAGKHFLVDTSRNGVSPAVSGWCNPPGAALGRGPATVAASTRVDQLVWVKPPGESDGVCGASRAPAGSFDVNLAVSLARRAGW